MPAAKEDVKADNPENPMDPYDVVRYVNEVFNVGKTAEKYGIKTYKITWKNIDKDTQELLGDSVFVFTMKHKLLSSLSIKVYVKDNGVVTFTNPINNKTYEYKFDLDENDGAFSVYFKPGLQWNYAFEQLSTKAGYEMVTIKDEYDRWNGDEIIFENVEKKATVTTNYHEDGQEAELQEQDKEDLNSTKSTPNLTIKAEIEKGGKKYKLVVEKTKIKIQTQKYGEDAQEEEVTFDRTIEGLQAKLEELNNRDLKNIDEFLKEIIVDYFYEIVPEEEKPNPTTDPTKEPQPEQKPATKPAIIEKEKTKDAKIIAKPTVTDKKVETKKQPATQGVKKVTATKTLAAKQGLVYDGNDLPQTGSFELVMASLASVFALISASLKKFVK